MTTNTALADEIEAVNSIYDAPTLSISDVDSASTSVVLKLPDQPLSFSISFPPEYPDVPPHLTGTKATGPNTKKGEGEATLNLLRDVLGRIFTPGQVCLFDLIEEITPLLQEQQQQQQQQRSRQTTASTEPTNSVNHDLSGSHGYARNSTVVNDRSPSPSSAPPLPQLSNIHIKDLASSSSSAAATSIPPPPWTLSDSLIVNKSEFVARALPVSNLSEAKDSISHLLSTDKRVASATHNITAWRIKTKRQPRTSSSSASASASLLSSQWARKEDGQNYHDDEDGPEITIQDCDDDGETAAGGRLLHLMQLMDVWNVVVVVTRRYGGVKLGPDRFRCINMVAREALVRGGHGVEDGGQEKGKKKKNKK